LTSGQPAGPSERRLAEVLGVSRPAVREALKRLTTAGLVQVRQGEATTVRDFRRHAGLDLLPRLLMRAGELDFSVVRSILETRLHNGPKVAELAAQRRRPELAGLLDDVLAKLGDEDDPVEQQRHALTFWDHVVDGADSIAFRLMYNTLRATYEPALPALATVMADEVGRPEAYRALADAISAGDPLGARQAAQDLLEPATTALIHVFILHWRPMDLGRLTIDPLLAREHRHTTWSLTYLALSTMLGICYEWTHYLIHSDYKPKTRFYRAIWRNHGSTTSATSTTGR
jgi:DNA-binding FadR family transcriptional regulator